MRAPEDDVPGPDLTGFESVPVRVVVRVGSGRCSLARLVELGTGDLVPLDRCVGEPFDLVASGVPLGSVEPIAGADGVSLKLVATAEELDDPAA
jgi:flagellar motor switch/type III secretory pathway protein FliN